MAVDESSTAMREVLLQARAGRVSIWRPVVRRQDVGRTIGYGGTMKYIMLVCYDPSVTDEEAADPDGYDIDKWVAEMDGRGVRLEGYPLAVGDAVTVRVRNRQVLLSDGPFTETKEHMAGYDILECSSLEEAVEVASKHPLARHGAMELRPFPPE
jgi:hypothetical protein